MPDFIAAASAGGILGADPSVSVPSGTQDGDLMLAWGLASGGITITATGAWTLHPASLTSQAPLWYRFASSEPASYTFTVSSTGTSAVAIATFRGVSASDPWDDYDSVGGATGVITLPSVDTDGIARCIAQMVAKAGTTTFTGQGEVFDTTVSSSSWTVAAGAQDQDAAGASGTKAWTPAAGTQGSIGYIVALNPVNQDASASLSEAVAFSTTGQVNTDGSASLSETVAFSTTGQVNTDSESEIEFGIDFLAEAVVESALDGSAQLNIAAGFSVDSVVGNPSDVSLELVIDFDAVAGVGGGGEGTVSEITRFRAAYALGIEEPELSTKDMGWLLREYWGRRAGLVGDLSTYSVYDIISVYFPGSHYIKDVY